MSGTRSRGEKGNNRRLPTGGRLDRNRPLRFRFDRRRYLGYYGDTLASALLANGVDITGRSFKLHRPRGILSAGLEEPNALVTLGAGGEQEVNLRATEIELYDGLEACSQNNWPNVQFDFGRINDVLARFLPAGFYHKTFMWPRWHWYEPFIRKAAGLGRLNGKADTHTYAQRNHHCDVLVIGAGPAGLSAALAAAASGASVMLLDAASELGGSLLREDAQIEGMTAAAWLDGALMRLAVRPQVTMLPRTTALGYYDDNFISAVERLDGEHPRQRLWKIRAARVVLATGAIERPLVFGYNDLPGIMLASATQEYARRYGVAPGRRVVFFTNNDSAYAVALDLHQLGVPVAAVIDVRERGASAWAPKLRVAGIALHLRSAVIRAHGGARVQAVEVGQLDYAGAFVDGTRFNIECDMLAMSGGWNPVVHLYSQAGGKLRYDDASACFAPDSCAQAVSCAGAANARFTLEECIADGGAAGGGADATPASALAIEPYWRTPPYAGRDLAHRQWVDFQHDVTVADIELAAREGFVSVEHLKRYTATGMAVDQGKTSNVNALAIMGQATGRAVGQVGTTTFRPPYHPVTIGALAGARVDELAQRYRRLPVSLHESLGGVLEDHSGWLRPAYYLRTGESEAQAIAREVRAARTGAALFDSSSLGKIEVRGRDAAEFLNRIYVNNIRTLKPGRLRYGLMLSEGGIIKDDGVCACLAPDHYLVCTSSSGALDIHFWMEEWRQCEWPQLDVRLALQTAQWATLTVSGPRSREVVAQLDTGIDLAPDAFPHMHIREGRIGALPVRVRRASFTGELSFEIDIAADYADALWQRLLELGAPMDLTPLGMEALDVLRIEKGFLEVGVDTDGETTPLDAGWGEAIVRKPDDFIGRRSLALPAMQRAGRTQLAGLLPDDVKLPVPAGTHVFDAQGAVLGHVTSACISPSLQRSIAMGRLRGGAALLGAEVLLDIGGTRHRARVAERAFYDPKGERLGG